MDFRLVYQGLLNGTGNRSASGNKHSIRRYFHRQLVNLWKTNPILRACSGIDVPLRGFMPAFNSAALMNAHTRGNKRYLPLVCDENGLSCSLEILLLRRDLGTVLVSGDLDGRVKTLIDALTIPVIGEAAEEGDEDPLYCLMSDDKLVYEVKVRADHLFAEPDQCIESPKMTPSGEYKISTNHVIAVVSVTTKGDPAVWS
jgi:hypothetical protein